MIDTVAKRYIKALTENGKKEDLEKILKDLETINQAFLLDKFMDILKSPTISEDKKIELILSFIKEPSEVLTNFIRVIAKHKRFGILQQIEEGLRSKIFIMNNEYVGKVYSKEKIEGSKIKDLEKNFSNKFNSKINLIPIISDFNGIKIELEDLGFEVSFSMDRLKEKMSDYILKGI